MGCWESQAHKASNTAIKMYAGNFMPDRRMGCAFAPQEKRLTIFASFVRQRCRTGDVVFGILNFNIYKYHHGQSQRNS
jgi:hypothetical protein